MLRRAEVAACSGRKRNKYSVGRMYNFLMLNLLVHQETVVFKKLNPDMLQVSSQPLLVSNSEKLTLECLNTTII
jgi:hypothetical protein